MLFRRGGPRWAETHDDTLTALEDLATAESQLGDSQSAARTLAQALAGRRAGGNDGAPATLADIGGTGVIAS